MFSVVSSRHIGPVFSRHCSSPSNGLLGGCRIISRQDSTLRSTKTSPVTIALTNPPNFFAKLKQTAAKYITGTKVLYHNVKAVRALKRRAGQNQALNYTEQLLVNTTVKDLKKLRPFLAIYIFLPEAIPFLVYRFPSFLPSTYETKQEKINRLINLNNRYTEGLVDILKTPTDQPITTQYRQILKTSIATTALGEAFSHSINITKGNGDILSGLNKKWLTPLCHSLGLSTYLPFMMIQRGLAKRFSEILQHDILLRHHGLDSLTPDQLQDASQMRALVLPQQICDKEPLEFEKMKIALEDWLNLKPNMANLPILMTICTVRLAAKHPIHGKIIRELLN